MDSDGQFEGPESKLLMIVQNQKSQLQFGKQTARGDRRMRDISMN